MQLFTLDCYDDGRGSAGLFSLALGIPSSVQEGRAICVHHQHPQLFAVTDVLTHTERKVNLTSWIKCNPAVVQASLEGQAELLP